MTTSGLLGNADWNNATRSHDALLLKYTNKEKKFNWHIGGAFNQNGEPLFETNYALNNYKFLAFTWLKKEFTKSSVSATAIVNGFNSVALLLKKLKPVLLLARYIITRIKILKQYWALIIKQEKQKIIYC